MFIKLFLFKRLKCFAKIAAYNYFSTTVLRIDKKKDHCMGENSILPKLLTL
jgi:hypothetical protein